MPREAAIVGAGNRELDRRGAWWIKTHGAGMGRNGIPDTLFTYLGHSGAFEYKAPRGRVGKLQAYELERLANAGAIVAVVRTIDDVHHALDRIEALARHRQEGA